MIVRPNFRCGSLVALVGLTIALANQIGSAADGEATGGGTLRSSQLITREHVRITLDGAEHILAGARYQAAEMKLKVNIAVVDDGGHLLAFARMDGARPASVSTAITKATSSATLRAATGPLPPGTDKPDALLNLSVQNAAAQSGGKFTTLYGGVPIIVEGQVIGAVGVGGATGEQDAEIARAGIKAFEKALVDQR